MKKIRLTNSSWEIECLPEDGARFSSLKYKGYELLTPSPATFILPKKDYGEYEIRPVYGYDDCFPTVDACQHPNRNFKCRDHGLLCWQSWSVTIKNEMLIGSTFLKETPIKFTRKLKLTDNSIDWQFEVKNYSGETFDFLHVMHPLMRLNEVTKIEVPKFEFVEDEAIQTKLELKDSKELNAYLNSVKKGNYKMLLLREIKENTAKITFSNKTTLNIEFDHKLFPTFGIWWNNNGYPDEKGITRNECAFEPIPGINSNLEESFHKKVYLSVSSGNALKWEIIWRMNE